MLKEFLSGGFGDSTPEYKYLEMLLFYCLPRVDTGNIARELLRRFHDMGGLLDAPIEEIAAVDGMGTKSAALLKLIIPISNIYANDKIVKKILFTSIYDVGEYVSARMKWFQVETVCAVLLDPSGNLVTFEKLAEGDLGQVGLSIRSLMNMCLNKNVFSVVIAHNHTNGVALPSASDLEFTERLIKSLAQANIKLLDHIIVANGDYVSLAISRDYKHLFK